MKKIAVLITSYNRKDKTLECLEYFYAAISNIQHFSFDIYLTDDASTDGTADAVKTTYPNICIIQSNGNLFWSRGMNLAWQTAANKENYDFYLWLNDDTLLMSDAIEILLITSEQKKNAIICGVCQSAETQKITYSGYTLNGNRIVPNGKITECAYFNGNLVLIPQKVFNQTGFLDLSYHHGISDFDYGLRASKAGILSYTTSCPIAYCERNAIPDWYNANLSLKKRHKYFKSPKGGTPMLLFKYNYKHFGLIKAMYVFITNYILLLCPYLKMKK